MAAALGGRGKSPCLAQTLLWNARLVGGPLVPRCRSRPQLSGLVWRLRLPPPLMHTRVLPRRGPYPCARPLGAARPPPLPPRASPPAPALGPCCGLGPDGPPPRGALAGPVCPGRPLALLRAPSRGIGRPCSVSGPPLGQRVAPPGPPWRARFAASGGEAAPPRGALGAADAAPWSRAPRGLSSRPPAGAAGGG